MTYNVFSGTLNPTQSINHNVAAWVRCNFDVMIEFVLCAVICSHCSLHWWCVVRTAHLVGGPRLFPLFGNETFCSVKFFLHISCEWCQLCQVRYVRTPVLVSGGQLHSSRLENIKLDHIITLNTRQLRIADFIRVCTIHLQSQYEIVRVLRNTLGGLLIGIRYVKTWCHPQNRK